MIRYENECVGCPKDWGCVLGSCPHMNVPHLICDSCDNEVDELYELDGDDVCFDCLLDIVGAKKIEL